MSAVLQEPITEATKMPVTVELSPEALREISATASALAVAQSYEVDCVEMAQALADERRAWAAKIDLLTKFEDGALAPAKKALVEMKAWVANQFGTKRADYTAARDLAGQKLLAWDQQEKSRLAREQAERDTVARQLRQAADIKAAAERARSEEQAREARRKEQEAREAQAKALAEGNARAAAAAAAEAAKQAEKAAAAVENGEAKAQAVQLEAAAHVQAAPVATVVKIAGQSSREAWVAELKSGVNIDQAKLMIVEAIAGGRHDLLALLELNTAPRGPLNKLAAALKGSMNVPGFVARVVTSIAGSRK